jgi:hypothetical protein
MKIKEFFDNLKHEINRAETVKALRILDKRAQSFRENIMRDEIKSSIKKSVLRSYKKIKHLIELKSKSL